MSKLPTIPPLPRVVPVGTTLLTAVNCADKDCPACLARKVIEWDQVTRRLRRGQSV